MRTADPRHATGAARHATSRAVAAEAAIGNARDLAEVCDRSHEQVLSAQGVSMWYQEPLVLGQESNSAATTKVVP